MTMFLQAPQIPIAYNPVALSDGANVRERSLALAHQAAEEGTLLWATRQTDGQARPGKTWHSPDGGLYVGLVLEPECPDAQCGELGLVGLLAVGNAIADLVAPMTDLAYRWPNDVILSGSKVAGLWLDWAAERLVLSLAVNVTQAPQQVIDAGCVLSEGGAPEITAELLLEGFARHFLDWINRWAEDGLAPVLKEFQTRHARAGSSMLVQLDHGESVAGALVKIDERGSLILQAGEQTRSVALGDFFGLK
ncbi:MAG: biotin--[acetyl-CoA-carboxylase] ligase [Wenzhouxiangella sp.]